MRKLIAILAWLLPFFLFPAPASAHSFGKLYNLPVPFWMYLYGGAAAIAASFVIIGFFINKTKINDSYPVFNISKIAIVKIFTATWFLKVLRIISVFLFLLTILTGFFGSDIATYNFNMTFFWIIFVLGLMYLTALIGNVYAVINPLKVMVEWVENLIGDKIDGFIEYPKKLSYYPALLFYILFIWIELLADTNPLTLSAILLMYANLNFFGVILLGKDAWFRYCEFFSVFFRLIGMMAPIEYKKGQLYLRPPFIGLLKGKAENFSLLLFVLFMLSSTAFDGFRSTAIWFKLFYENINLGITQVFGGSAFTLYNILGLLLSPVIFLVLYLVLVLLAKVITRSKQSLKELSLQFAFSLIPIAFVYNIAHYYTLLVVEGSNIISLISDPFGLGWNIFGTVSFTGIATVDANFVWHSQVVLILLGHIVGVYLAHLVAIKIFPSHKRALLSQIPMLILMVSYTMIGLWILSQPITSGEVSDVPDQGQPTEVSELQEFEEPMFIPRPVIDTNEGAEVPSIEQ